MSVSGECCVLSVRGFCDGPITRSEESYRGEGGCGWCRGVVSTENITLTARETKPVLPVVNHINVAIAFVVFKKAWWSW